MLNRNSKKFIKFLRKHKPDYNDLVYTYDFIEENYPDKYEYVIITMRYLIKEGYLEVSTFGSGSELGVALTEKAMHPHDFTWLRIKKLIFESIIIPIVVSAATSLVTLWLQGLL